VRIAPSKEQDFPSARCVVGEGKEREKNFTRIFYFYSYVWAHAPPSALSNRVFGQFRRGSVRLDSCRVLLLQTFLMHRVLSLHHLPLGNK
jgi:hypothetical protein